MNTKVIRAELQVPCLQCPSISELFLVKEISELHPVSKFLNLRFSRLCAACVRLMHGTSCDEVRNVVNAECGTPR